MVQVLPYVQTPLEQLTPYLQQAAGQLGQGLQQRSAMQGLQSFLNPQASQQAVQGQQAAGQAPNLNPQSIAHATSLAEKAGMSPASVNAISQSLQNQQKAQEKQATEISKENRAEIKKFAEPYSDIGKLKTNTNKLEEAKKMIQSGKVSFDENMLRGALTGIAEGRDSPLQDVFKTPEQQKLWYLLRDALKPKEIGGSNPSTREVLIAMSALPSQYKGRAANEYIIQSMINESLKNEKTSEVINDIRKTNPSISFPEFSEEISKRVTPYYSDLSDKLEQRSSYLSQTHGKKLAKDSVWVVSPDGVVGSIPKSKIREAKENNYEVLD